MIDLEFPDAVLLDRLVLIDGAADRGAAAEAHLLQHANADPGALPVFRHIDDGLDLDVIPEPVLDGPFFAVAREGMEQKCTHAIPAPINTTLRELDRSVPGEKVCEVVEQVLVQVVAVGALEILQLVEIFHASDALFRRGDQVSGVFLFRFTRLQMHRHQG